MYKVTIKERWAPGWTETDPRVLLKILQATSLIGEKYYKKESSVNKGGLRREVYSRKTEYGYFVTTSARSDTGKPYPVFLYEGTGAMRGRPDFGYTPGRIRAGDVQRGIGGIRPNKISDRAGVRTAPEVLEFTQKRVLKLYGG